MMYIYLGRRGRGGEGRGGGEGRRGERRGERGGEGRGGEGRGGEGRGRGYAYKHILKAPLASTVILRSLGVRSTFLHHINFKCSKVLQLTL